MQNTTVHNGVVTNRNIISDRCTGSFECTMNARSILDIYFITYADEIHIAANHCIEPDAAVVTHDHITNDSGVGSNETIFSKLRVFVFNRKYDRHWQKNLRFEI